MAADDVEIYFDLGSPYAHLAVARAERDLGRPPVLRPVLLGAIFRARGFGSWSASAQRQQRIAELEARAERYGLPPFVWPQGWPLDGLAAMRACIWTEAEGALDHFAAAVFEHEFGRGEDVSAPPALAGIATEIGKGSDVSNSCIGVLGRSCGPKAPTAHGGNGTSRAAKLPDPTNSR